VLDTTGAATTALARPPSRTSALIPMLHRDGMSDGDVDRVFATFNVTSFTIERFAQ
jgi:hypothetical protein